jgi:hypothetical protein
VYTHATTTSYKQTIRRLKAFKRKISENLKGFGYGQDFACISVLFLNEKSEKKAKYTQNLARSQSPLDSHA